MNVSDEEDSEALMMSLETREKSWVIDSGASFHATSHKELLHNYGSGNFKKVYLGNDETYNIIGKGEVQINQPNETTLKINDVRHVTCLKKNLISVGQLKDSGIVTIFASDTWKMTKGAMVVARGKREGTLYVMSVTYSVITITSSEVEMGI